MVGCLGLAAASFPAAAQPPAVRGPSINTLMSASAATAVIAGESEPPREVANPYLKQPSLVIPKPLSADGRSRAEQYIHEAERHFQSGKFFIQEGLMADARAEFDRAINTLLDAPADLPDRALVEKASETLIRLIYRYDIDSLGSGQEPESPVFVQSPLPDILDLTFPLDPGLKGKTSARVAATVSELPLVANDAVLSYVNFFTSERGRRILSYGLKHSSRYRAMIQRVLHEEGVPQELIYLAQAESGFAPRAVSNRSAAGMWQFLRSRGTEYGLEYSRLFDDRLDPEKATRAAARHLRDLFNQLGDWHLAMAAYNCGPYCVERASQRTGYADFWELRERRALPKETMNYVPAILAMAIVCKNADAFGINVPEAEREPEIESVKVAVPTNLGLVADACDLPVGEIRALNPGLLKNIAPAGYDVRIPHAKTAGVLSALESVPEDKRVSWRLHRLAGGDTLASIARRYSVAGPAIVKANSRLDASYFEHPEAGEVILIPLSSAPDTAPRSAARARTGASTRRAQPAPLKSAGAPAGHRPLPTRAATSAAATRQLSR